MKCAVDKIVNNFNLLKDMGRLGLVINQTSTTSNFISSAEIIYEATKKTTGAKVTAVFGPQHGYGQTEQDNMKETPHGTFTFLDDHNVPLYSLYSETRIPTAEQMEKIDTFIIDLQDIGCRVYTYMLTLAGCMRGASEFAKKVVVLDRGNPLGLSYYDSTTQKWQRVEGSGLHPSFHSFVGWYDLPLRHGMTMGELGNYFIVQDNLKLDYQVILVDDLTRSQPIDVHALTTWTMPSPNIPHCFSAFLFPAFVLLEGTNVSEGRGSTLPFQLIGAPWLNARQCISFLEKEKEFYSIDPSKPCGLVLREHQFRPTFNKYMGQICHGIQFHIKMTENINLFKLGLTFVAYCYVFHGEHFQWAKPGYEYNFDQLPIHLILGNDSFYQFLESQPRSDDFGVFFSKFKEFVRQLDDEAQKFSQANQKYFLYK